MFLAKGNALMKVSVITPTHCREELLGNLYGTFQRQTHPDKELLVFDDSPRRSVFMEQLADSRVRYLYSGVRLPIGYKRNHLVQEATGDAVVQFDDDDYYAPRYIEEMTSHLDRFDLVKLTKWFVLDSASGDLFFWDTTAPSDVHFRLGDGQLPRPVLFSSLPIAGEVGLDRTQWGYGFSYVFRRSIYGRARFDCGMDKGQDYAFVRECRRHGFTVGGISDETGLALHVVHGENVSRVFPNYRLPQFVGRHLFGDVLDRYGPCGRRRMAFG